jgi:hypothetical protein
MHAFFWAIWLAFVTVVFYKTRQDWRDPEQDRAITYAMGATGAIIALIGAGLIIFLT